MKITVVGGGKVGFTIARELTLENHDVTIIDNNRAQVDFMSSTLDALVIFGNGAELDVQRAANVKEQDLLIACTSNDELNILACILARKIGCKNTIARICNADYTEELYMLKLDIGLSMIVNPDASTAMEIFRLMQYPGFLKREAFTKSLVEIVEIAVRSDNPICGKKLMDLPKLIRRKILVCAVKRGDATIIPDGSFELADGDRIFVTASVTDLPHLLDSMHLRKKKAQNVMIIGGGSLGSTLAALLTSADVRVRLIEKDPVRCKTLAEDLPRATVICADGTDHNVLRSENISGMDAVVSLTNTDEENVFISVFSEMQGVPQTITKVNRTEYSDVCRRCGIDSAISPKDICAEEVIRYVRAMQSADAENVLSVYRLADEKVEALEFLVAENDPHCGEPLSELKLKKNILIACITRGNEVIFPGGGDCLQADDAVVVITFADSRIIDLKDIFA